MVSAEEPSTGQRVHVAGLSAALACRGHAVTVYTRLESPLLPDRERKELGYDVVRVAAGPAVPIDENEMISQLGRLAERLGREWCDTVPDVVHAHGWTSGLTSVLAQ